MKYTVTWKPSALNELARLWNSAPHRSAVAAAADRIDDTLQQDPQSKGESRTGPTRLLIDLPLAVLFEVSDADRLVTVLAVWRPHQP